MSNNVKIRTSYDVNGARNDVDDDDEQSRDSSIETSTLSEQKKLDLRYGCFGYKPRCLQWLNGVGGFVSWLCMANCLLTMACALYGVVLSTMERRFGFSSSESSWIATACEIGPIPVLILISYFGNRLHRPLSCAIGLFSIAAGSILFFVPQFTTPLYHPQEHIEKVVSGNDLCSAKTNFTSECHHEVAKNPSVNIAIFFIARLLMGVGSTPVQTLGVTYMDDCTTRGKFATYTGFYHAMSIVGSALAYVGGGFMLKIFVDFYAVDSSKLEMTPHDSNWIGAWWLPFTIMAGLSLLNAIPMMGYPVDLPGTAEIRKTRISEAHNGDIGESSHNKIGYITTWGEFKQMFKNVLTNPTYLCLTTYVTTHNFIVEGFSSFGPKVFEVQFNLSKSLAGAIFGVVLLPAGAGGTIIGGLLIEKLKLTCRQIIRIQTVLVGIATIGFCLILITCEPLRFAGVNIPYNHSQSSSSSSSSSLNLTSVCNAGCECQNVIYDPICSHDNVIYYSPCHAGCSTTQKDDDVTNYYNCSCIESSSEEEGAAFDATSNTCSAGFCPIAIVFMIAFFITVTLVFICFTMNMTATLRCVSSSQTSFAIGIQYLFSQTFGSILGPLFMGMAFDKACVLWRYDKCGSAGNCFAYDNKQVSVNFFIILFSAKVISLVVMIFAVVLYKPPRSRPAPKTLLKTIPHSTNSSHS